MICLLIKPMLWVFTLAIKFDCLFSNICSKFLLIGDFNFWQLAPLNVCFKWCFKSLFSPFQRKKTVSKELKTWYFPYSAFWLTGQWGAIFPASPMATLLLVGLLRHIMVNRPWLMHYIHKKAIWGSEIATFRTKTLRFLRVLRLNWLAKVELRGTQSPWSSILFLVILL